MGGLSVSFPEIKAYSNTTAISESHDSKYFLKVEIRTHPDKANTIRQEYEIMKVLNEKGCVTCPKVYGFGQITHEELLANIDANGHSLVRQNGTTSFDYTIQQLVPFSDKIPFSDVLLAMIEQKNLGVFHGDLKPDCLRFDPRVGICFLIDYDQAEYIPEAIRDADNLSFFRWCDERAKAKYAKWNFKRFLHYFPQIDFDRDCLQFFNHGAFNMGATSPFLNQKTTLSQGGVYHSFHFDSVFAKGERDLSGRLEPLSKITFKRGETVLDVGCNVGLFSQYLYDQGCRVTGIDLDENIISGARLLANICRKDIRFESFDLDHGIMLGQFDTIVLLSVIHHTQNIVENAKNIASLCNRIIIECRLKETGAKPVNGVWRATTAWDFPDFDSLIFGLESLFPSFKFKKNYGQGDRDRHIIELGKTTSDTEQ